MSLRVQHLGWPALLTTAWIAGCGSSSGTSVAAVAPAGMVDGGTAAGDAGGANAADAGPGELANGCPTNTGYVGDEMCLPPPTPAQGFQLHYGPSDYDAPGDMKPFVLTPGEETVDCFYTKATNEEARYVSGFQFYMRPGSHHLIVNLTPPHPDGFDLCGLADPSNTGFGGSQTPKVDELTDPAPENQGLALKVPAHAQTMINFHVLDSGQRPILREAWLNYLYIDPAQVKGLRGGLALTGGIGFHIEPGTHQNYTYSCSPDRPVRVLQLAAHMHVHSQRMTAWKVANGAPTLVYQSFDWAEPPSYRYDSVTTNPVTNAATHTPGATSGALVVNPGESLQWECEIDNPPDGQLLTFRNEVKTGEMCLLTGSVVAADDPMNPYDFSCTRN